MEIEFKDPIAVSVGQYRMLEIVAIIRVHISEKVTAVSVSDCPEQSGLKLVTDKGIVVVTYDLTRILEKKKSP